MNKRLNLNRNSVFKKSIKDDKDIIENVKDLIGIIKNTMKTAGKSCTFANLWATRYCTARSATKAASAAGMRTANIPSYLTGYIPRIAAFAALE
jgi:hypothetical protein